MKTIICIVLVLFVTSTYSASIQTGYYHNPKNDGWCTITDSIKLEPGRHKDTRPGVPCGLTLCYNDGSAEFHTCSVKEIFIPGFRYDGFEDLTKEYPECCKLKIVHV